MCQKLLLYGCGGSYNHGTEAILKSTLCMLPKGNYKIFLSSNFPNQDREFGIDLLVDEIIGADFSYIEQEKSAPTFAQKEFFASKMYEKALSVIDSDTVCVGIGGDMYCYPNWYRQTIFHKAAKAAGGKSFLWCCSIQPEMIDDIMLSALREHDQIYVRESESEAALRSHQLTNVTRIPDPAFRLPAIPFSLPQDLFQGFTIGINLSPLVLRRSNDLLFHFIKSLKFLLSKADKAVFIPHVTVAVDNDYDAYREICSHLTTEERDKIWHPENPLDAMHLKYLISKCSLLICSRTHASIAGYSSAVPTLVLGYSIKSKGIAVDLGMQEWVVPLEEISTLPDVTVKFFDQLPLIKNNLSQHLPCYLERCHFPSNII